MIITVPRSDTRGGFEAFRFDTPEEAVAWLQEMIDVGARNALIRSQGRAADAASLARRFNNDCCAPFSKGGE